MVSCNLVFNEHRFKTPALVNTRVNGYVLFNIKFAQRLSRFLSTLIHILLTLIIIYRFDRQSRQVINRYIILYLRVDGRKQYNVFIVLLDINYRDLIFNYTQFNQQNIQLNLRLRQLVQPAITSRSLELVKVRYYNLEILKSRLINPDY